MNRGWLVLLGAAMGVSVPASAALQDDGSTLVSSFLEIVRADPVLLQAAKQNASGAGASAIPALLSYTRANPRIAEGWYLLSMAYGEAGRPDLAKAAISRATAIKPSLNDLTRYLHARMAGEASSKEPKAPAPAADPGIRQSSTGKAAPSGALKQPVLGVYQCYFATYTRWTASDYGDAPIAKLTLSPGKRFTYANSGGTYALGGGNEITFNGLKASYYTGARLVEDGTRTAIQLQFGQYGVQNCVNK